MTKPMIQSVTRKKVVIFGDSHYACMRAAHTEGLVDPSMHEVEYWGHVGRRFRMLEFRDGAIHPTDEFTADRFAKFNEQGRRFLAAKDFDYIVFMGCRIDIARVFISLVDAQMRGAYLSDGLRRAMVRGRICAMPSYQFAVQMAALGQARILLHPITIFGQGTDEYDDIITDAARAGTAQARAEVWQIFQEEMARDQITLLPQLDHTFAEGVYTDRSYLVDGHAERNDYTHRTAAYGALVWGQVLGAMA